jgi:hypothetical protein
MRNMKRLILVVFSLVFLYSGTATALAPFGPPRAIIGAQKWAIGAEFSYQTMDMQSFGTYREGYSNGVSYDWYCKYNQFDLKDLKSNLIFGRLGYGLGDTWDIFARVGFSNSSGDLEVSSIGSDGPSATGFFQGGEQFPLDNGYALAWGIGSRMTFAETGDIAWGTILQMTWLNPKKSSSSWSSSFIGVDATIDLSYWEIELAAGPTINLGKAWLYGGPFLYFAKGNLDIQGTWSDMGLTGPIQATHDIREDSNFGGYGGMQLNMAENLCLYAEGQFTGNGWGIGSGIAWRVY